MPYTLDDTEVNMPVFSDVKSEKTPLTRLLDLTAGWADFAQREDNGWPDPAVSVEELGNLYQEAGALLTDNLSAEEETRIVREFVETRLLSLLLRRPLTVRKMHPSGQPQPY